ncbi:hypothetical protein H2248_007551 [Termitomyces sp. 'cryptogamus']|nr:hypothetical protein H2248_007551 [Termitomyces sp. 'cryptogamus']
MTTTTTTPNLREALLGALSELGGTRTFHLHVLVSMARKHGDLFPFANPRPRAYLQDILILLSEEKEGGPRKLVVGVEAHVYAIPSTHSAILYVSKVDTTGQASAPSPTFCVVQTLIGFYVDGRTRPRLAGDVEHVWVHVFARAQGQYLFPNSAEYAGKRPLSDVQLCRWWKRVFEAVEAGLGTGSRRRLYYVLPGYGEMEAVQALGSAGKWTYGHPYGETEIVLPCPRGDSLGHYIPSFEDDPKGRFMEEIAYSTESPRGKRTQGELGKVDGDEFWERMSFRQECVAGAVTGFFVLGISSSSTSPCGAEAGLVGAQVVERVLGMVGAHEFSSVERTVRATAVVEGGVRGLCGDVSGRVATAGAAAGAQAAAGPAVTVLTARRKR